MEQVSINSIIALMEQRIQKEPTGELEPLLQDLVLMLEQGKYGLPAVEAVLRLMEKYPLGDFGSPGGLVHFMERFEKHGYENILMQSLERRPTCHTVWMLNRLANGAEGEAKHRCLDWMKRIAGSDSVDQEVKSDAIDYLAYQLAEQGNAAR